uniref:Uncharacterized protein n=1 Tax=Rhizophora mucronata TaxID=61149 RepID=A0A2P2NTE2_RHIMU
MLAGNALFIGCSLLLYKSDNNIYILLYSPLAQFVTVY